MYTINVIENLNRIYGRSKKIRINFPTDRYVVNGGIIFVINLTEK